MRPLTRSCFLLHLLKRLFLLALPFPLKTCLPSWNPPNAPAPILLFLAKVRLSLTLALFHLAIWCSGQTGLLILLLERAALACLPTARSVALRPLFLFQQAQCAHVFPLKPAPFCTLFTGLGSTNKSVTSLLFSSYLTFDLSLPPYSFLHIFFHLNLSVRSAAPAFSLLLFYQATMGSRTFVSPGKRRG